MNCQQFRPTRRITVVGIADPADTVSMEPLRSESGQFARRGVRDARTLYAILRAVAEAAIVERPTANPRKVTTRQWRDARHLCEAEFGPIPLPQEIRRQLAKLKGELLPFPELLAIAFGDRGEITRVHTRLQAEEESQQWMSDRHVWYALRYVARSLAPAGAISPDTTLLPRTYERDRRRLIAADARRKKPVGLAERLPTHLQLARYAGTWDRALEIAQLAPRPQIERPKTVRRSLSVPEAIVRYYEVVGILPTVTKLIRFRRDYGFAVRSYPSNVPFRSFLPEALALIAARDDLATPRPYDETKYLAVSWPVPEDAADPDHPTRVRAFTRPELLRWVIRFVETLGPGEAATYIRWATFKIGRPDCPSTGTLINHGGLPALVAEARRPDAIKRAEATRTAERTASREEALLRGLDSPRAEALIAAMRDLGGAFVRKGELHAALGWTHNTILAWLRKLQAGGVVEIVEAGVGRNGYCYGLTDLNLPEEEVERLRFEAQARDPTARRLLEELANQGDLRSGRLAAAIERSSCTVSFWTRRLIAAGFVERIGTDPRSKKGYRITDSGRALLADGHSQRGDH